MYAELSQFPLSDVFGIVWVPASDSPPPIVESPGSVDIQDYASNAATVRSLAGGTVSLTRPLAARVSLSSRTTIAVSQTAAAVTVRDFEL